MRTFCTVIGAPLALALSTAAFAQERHVVTADKLAQTVSQYVTKQDADRATIRETLARPEVKSVAERAGIDIGRVSASIDALPPESLERAAATARDVNQALVGGASTIVISTTTIIIILLIVILVAVL
jgi:predicted xylose isomerase-like sugar epimerase